MNDSLFFFVTIAAFVAAMAAAHFFKTLDPDLWHAWRTSLVAGIVIGVVLRLVHTANPILAGILLTAGMLYARHTGRESEAVDGMLLGSVMGAIAALPLLELRAAASLMLAGAVAGYGVIKARKIPGDVVTAIAAALVAWLPQFIPADDRDLLLAVAIALPLFIIAAVFRQWPDVRAELRHEASLGFMDDADVRRTAHPILRLGRGGWADRRAHREFVRRANEIALRKRRQRGRPDEVARLYQLEIIKLRMQIQEMSRIDRDVRRRAEGQMPSDTIRVEERGMSDEA